MTLKREITIKAITSHGKTHQILQKGRKERIIEKGYITIFKMRQHEIPNKKIFLTEIGRL